MALVDLYKDHLNRLIEYYVGYLHEQGLKEAWVHYGDFEKFFNDDMEKNFRANPFAIHLINEPGAVGSYIRIDDQARVTLFNYQDLGYWNVPIDLDFELFEQSGLVKVVRFTKQEEIIKVLSEHVREATIVTPQPRKFKELGFKPANVNNEDLIKDLEELRLQKTPYEYEMLCQAQYLAIKAHRALKAAVFGTNFSENQLLGVYLQNAEMPYDKQGYSSILAFNRNAAILHYNQLDFEAPAKKRSFLVDAGATYKGYQADVSRTYCLDENDLFNDLILGVSNIKDEIIAHMRPGVLTTELQTLMQRKTAELLIDAHVFVNIDIDKAMELKMPHKFIPHGFGHSMGIGVHDVMGRPKMPQQPGIRASHKLEVGNVWTVEPGIYFIDELIQQLKDDPETAQYVDFDLLDQLHPYGGIRVEDNVMLQETQLINFTGDLETI